MLNSLSAGASDAKSQYIGDPERYTHMVVLIDLKKGKMDTRENIFVLGIMYIIAFVRSRRRKQPKTDIMANSASAAADGMQGQIVGGTRMRASPATRQKGCKP